MTTTVAIAAQYASGNPTSRPSSIAIVAASAVRKACDSDGRFSRFQAQSFMAANHLRIWLRLASSRSIAEEHLAAFSR